MGASETFRPMAEADIEALRARLRGLLLQPGADGYDDARAVWNAMIDRRPAAIVRCMDTSDVVACVNFAREHGVALSVKGGGHNIAGLAVCDAGVMLDMSLQRGVRVDPAARIAHAQAGCLLADVDRETQAHGLAAVLGFVSNTGIAGLTLGGGFGYLTRRFGWSCDSLASVQVVTADGRIVRASDDENADLFWALRGGGGNFGVATSFEYRLHAVGPDIVGGVIAWHAEAAQDVLGLMRELFESAPPEFVCVGMLRRAPPAPWLPPAVHGQPIVGLLVCDTGALADAERRVAPIKAFGTPVGDIVQRRSYTSQQSLLDATQPKGRRYYWKSEYLPALDGALITQAIEHAARCPSPHSVILLFPLRGSIGALGADHSAVGNRDAGVVLNIAASWEQAGDDAANIDWARAAWRDMRRFSTGGTYINFLTEEEGADRIRAAYGANYDRLVAVKTAWDPGNLFRCNQNIPPR
jgi:FAD/FMN-containing dehydrogenase